MRDQLSSCADALFALLDAYHAPLSSFLAQSYSGSWKNGQWHGWGRLFSNDNSSVEGQFVENQLHGFGCRVDDEEGVVSYVKPLPPPPSSFH